MYGHSLGRSVQHPAALAQICGVAPHRLALSEKVTIVCVLPLWGLPFEAGDRLLISDCEHPGVVAACVELARRENLEIDTLPVKQLRGDQPSTDAGVMDALEQSLTPRTRLVVLSHLLWNTGQIRPRRRRGTARPAPPGALPAGGCRPGLGRFCAGRCCRRRHLCLHRPQWACPEGLGAWLCRNRC